MRTEKNIKCVCAIHPGLNVSNVWDRNALQHKFLILHPWAYVCHPLFRTPCVSKPAALPAIYFSLRFEICKFCNVIGLYIFYTYDTVYKKFYLKIHCLKCFKTCNDSHKMLAFRNPDELILVSNGPFILCNDIEDLKHICLLKSIVVWWTMQVNNALTEDHVACTQDLIVTVI